MQTITITLNVEDEEGETTEVEHELPAKNEVCERCEGYGTHLNPSIGNHAYTREEFNEAFDEDGREEYFRRGGIYDVKCEVCHGNRVVLHVDEARLTPQQREVYEEYFDQKEEEARWDYEDRMTRRMENGGWDY